MISRPTISYPYIRCRFCWRMSSRKCDFELDGQRAGMICAAPTCSACCSHRGLDECGKSIDYCLAHARVVGKGERA